MPPEKNGFHAPDPASGSLRSTLSRLELRSPPMPQTMVEAMDLMNQPDRLEVEPVSEMVRSDPIVVARILQIVNSAYYGLQRAIDSADRAVVMLGPVAVTGIVMGMNMLQLRSALEGPASRSFIKLIRHCIATAFLTRHLVEGPPRIYSATRRPKLGRIGSSFTAGLLHDFGKVILVYNFPDAAVELYEKLTYDGQLLDQDMRDLEQLIFGCDHTEAGEYVTRKLAFPDVLTDVVRNHHEPEQSTGNDETDRIIRAVAAANLAAKALGYAFTQSSTWSACLNDPIWSLLHTCDLPRYATPEAIAEDLQAQQEHLDEYVQHLTAAAVSSASTSNRHIPE